MANLTEDQQCGHTTLYIDSFLGPERIAPCVWCRLEAAESKNQWTPVASQLPPSGKKVLVFWKNELGNGRRTCAEWVEARTQSAENFDDNTPDDWFDVDESGTSWIPEGWYETSETAEERRYIAIPVSHWMALPEMPA